MNTPEKNAFIKTVAISALSLAERGTQIGPATYVLPVNVEGVTRYAKVTVSACNDKDTKTTKGFVLAEAVNAFEIAEAEKTATAKAKAVAKESKAKAKESKAKTE